MITITAMRDGPTESISIEELQDGSFRLRIDRKPPDCQHLMSAEIVLTRQHAQFLGLLLGADGHRSASPEP
jgi:hypothetical protein